MASQRRAVLDAAARAMLACLGSAVVPRASAEGGGAATAQVDIRDYKFVPELLSVKVGSTVRWTNHEKRTTHSVLFTGDGGFESERMFPGDSWQRTFDKAGSYAYTCGPHPEMKGRIEVTA